MGRKFEYVDNGNIILYFATTFLGIILIPWSYYFLLKAGKQEQKQESQVKCNCGPCKIKAKFLSKIGPKEESRKRFTKTVLTLGWLLFAFVSYQISQIDYEYSNFDPYEILGVSSSATKSAIRKAYKSLSLTYHPDKASGNEKLFVKIAKAYQTLTDPTAKRNWEEYGNPDGPGYVTFGVALPSWLVEGESSTWLLAFYAFAVPAIIIIFVILWWKRSARNLNEEREIKTAILDLSPSGEIESSESKANKFLKRHFLEKQLTLDKLEPDQLKVIQKSSIFIQEIVLGHSIILMMDQGKGKLSKEGYEPQTLQNIEDLMKMSPMLVQALWHTKSPLAQLPHLTDKQISYLENKRKIASVQQFYQLKDEDRRNILNDISDEMYADVMNLCESMPLIDMQATLDDKKSEFTVGEVVVARMQLTRKNLGSLQRDTNADSNVPGPPKPENVDDSDDDNQNDEEDDEKWEKYQKKIAERRKKVREAKAKTSPVVHCPYFPGIKREFWWIYIRDTEKGTFLTCPFLVTNLIEEGKFILNFKAPSKPGHYKFTACLRSDSFLGFDQTEDFEIYVKEKEGSTRHSGHQDSDAGEENEMDAESGESDYTDDGEEEVGSNDDDVTDSNDDDITHSDDDNDQKNDDLQ